MEGASGRLAGAVHRALYLGMFLLPLSGWALSSTSGVPARIFGLFPLPHPLPADRLWAEWWRAVHRALAWAFALLVGFHLAAALRHGWRRDGILGRMFGGGAGRRRS
ncbi:MAG: hypothetical protein KatS3mg124_1234 [Porticoccaceae bacterium]|nr:MAG: hypothetical protein KatS3mg124_1234 [Porticoccaceae bacterium]